MVKTNMVGGSVQLPAAVGRCWESRAAPQSALFSEAAQHRLGDGVGSVKRLDELGSGGASRRPPAPATRRASRVHGWSSRVDIARRPRADGHGEWRRARRRRRGRRALVKSHGRHRPCTDGAASVTGQKQLSGGEKRGSAPPSNGGGFAPSRSGSETSLGLSERRGEPPATPELLEGSTLKSEPWSHFSTGLAVRSSHRSEFCRCSSSVSRKA
mmetsp:Transcript_57803/g.125486  ORF Transcript_57803/g.125486 Transcript_57803/m.125486 type:complete len:213 (-) Transcript_57803:1019-1657(-)